MACVPVPEMNQSRIKDIEIVDRMLKKFDPAQRDAGLRALGQQGEECVFRSGQNRLSAIGRDDLAGKVRRVAEEEGGGAGCDILSYSAKGHMRWLEVKTTSGSKATPFWISENERRVSEENPEIFRLIRLFDFAREPTAYKLRPPLGNHAQLLPTH